MGLLRRREKWPGDEKLQKTNQFEGGEEKERVAGGGNGAGKGNQAR